MNREIKFRAWDNYKHEMNYKVCVGNTVDKNKLYTAHSLYHSENPNIGYWTHFDENSDIFLMQYTGLKDKNGKEIYEGDFIKCYTGNPTYDDDAILVIWHKEFASFALAKNGWLYDHFFREDLDPKECEIIGNKYENPELMEVKND